MFTNWRVYTNRKKNNKEADKPLNEGSTDSNTALVECEGGEIHGATGSLSWPFQR
jgi:hypothetical protein